jgi:hypothetical protein
VPERPTPALGEYRRGSWRPWTVAPRSGADDREEGAYVLPPDDPGELVRDEIPDSARSRFGADWILADGVLSVDLDTVEDLSADLEPTVDLEFEVTRPPDESPPGEIVRGDTLRPTEPAARLPAAGLPVTRDEEPSEVLSSVRSNDRIWVRAPLPRELALRSPVRLTAGRTSGCRSVRLIRPRPEACWRLRATLEMCRFWS